MIRFLGDYEAGSAMASWTASWPNSGIQQDLY